MNKLSKFILTPLLVLFSWPVLSKSWSDIGDERLKIEVEQLRLCGISVPPTSSYPFNLSALKKILINTDNANLSANCLEQVNGIHKVIDRQLYNSTTRIGLQMKRPDIYFRATKASFNYSNNSNFFIENISDDATILEMNIKQRLTKNIEFKLMLYHTDFIETTIYDNLSANASLEYRW